MCKRWSHRNGETEPPTMEGEYWFRQWDGGPHDIVLVYEVMVIDKPDGYIELVGFNSASQEESPIEDFLGEWYGPIPEPGAQP